MDKASFKLILRYLKRFTEGPLLSRQKWTAFWRYAGQTVDLVGEKLTGLDYSMVYYTKDESDEHHSVYTKVPDKVLKRIFADIGDVSDKRFFDVGCGKGYAVTRAAQCGFAAAGGIEYSDFLYETCCKNLRKKGISTERVYHGNAAEFDHYGDFDVFFMNNPFDETIMEPVAEKMFEALGGRECLLYFLNPHLSPRTEAVEKAGFRLLKKIPDPDEEYFNINVYTNIPAE